MKAGLLEIFTAFEKKLDFEVQKLPAGDARSPAREANQKISSAYLQLARDMTKADLSAEGLAVCRKAQQADPYNLDADCFILARLEKLNRVEEAWAGLLAIESRHKAPYDTCPKLNFIKACIEYRRGNLENARAILETFIAQNSGHSHLAHAYIWLGKTLDRLGQYDGAMQAIIRSKAIISATPEAREMSGKTAESLAAIETSLRWYSGQTSFCWQNKNPPDRHATPILLVGFPRSGTTLQDQILNSHSALTTLEEKSTLAGISENFFGSEEKLLSLHQLHNHEIATYRQIYWSNIECHMGRSVGGDLQVVDKLPHSIKYLDIYTRLFPGIKIIVALRDPRDCILSNYFQMYKLNPAMAASLNLESCAKYYAKVMGLYLQFRKFIPDNIHEVCYENVVLDFKGECTRLLDFIGLEWEAGLECYHENAQSRRIKTPSYSQVIKPLYNDSIGRWRNYASHLENITPILQPFIEAFGYQQS